MFFVYIDAMNDQEIFGFEQDFSGSLRCIPMVVRFKLDHCGVKLTLRQWSRFSVDERRQLVEGPCASAGEIAAYGQSLRQLIVARMGEPAQDVVLEAHPAWRDTTEVPLRVDHQRAPAACCRQRRSAGPGSRRCSVLPCSN